MRALCSRVTGLRGSSLDRGDRVKRYAGLDGFRKSAYWVSGEQEPG